MKVVVTGMGAISSLGNDVGSFYTGLINNDCHVKCFDEWKQLNGLNAFLGAPVPQYDSSSIPRQIRRCMSPMSEMAYMATVEALNMAQLPVDFSHFADSTLDTDRMLICLGSTSGSPITLETHFKKYFTEKGPRGQLSTSFFKIMNHSVAANVAAGLKYLGPLSSISSACSTSTQAIVQGHELIKAGLYDIVIAGGADEIHPISVSIFDGVHSASRHYHDHPTVASRPFDKNRDGLVLSEGASVVVLESLEHAQKRGARPLVEVLGGSYICDSTHMTQPQSPAIVKAMELALAKAQIAAQDVDYINAHATSTRLGDKEEGQSIARLFGSKTPVSSLKGHLGHSLAAAGGLEFIASVKMLENQMFIATRNLEELDPECGEILALNKNMDLDIDIILSNNFAFGGMNTCVILAKFG